MLEHWTYEQTWYWSDFHTTLKSFFRSKNLRTQSNNEGFAPKFNTRAKGGGCHSNRTSPKFRFYPRGPKTLSLPEKKEGSKVNFPPRNNFLKDVKISFL